MTPWFPAIVSLTGMGGFVVYAAVVWIGDRLGWLDKDEPVGAIGCCWILACCAMVVLGFLLSLGIGR